MSDVEGMRAEIDHLRKRLASARADVLTEMLRHVAGNMENARSLMKYGDEAKTEARCRALATGYLEDVVECLRMDDQQVEYDGLWQRLERLHARVDAVLRRAADVGSEEAGDGE